MTVGAKRKVGEDCRITPTGHNGLVEIHTPEKGKNGKDRKKDKKAPLTLRSGRLLICNSDLKHFLWHTQNLCGKRLCRKPSLQCNLIWPLAKCWDLLPYLHPGQIEVAPVLACLGSRGLAWNPSRPPFSPVACLPPCPPFSPGS